MRYDPDHKARTHRRILKNAARRFRAEGLNGPGVATVMKASGLTVGGFYEHFRSKDDLLIQAVEEGFAEFREKVFDALKNVPPADRWRGIVRWYLSPEHCDHSATGCPIAALAPEIARAAPAVRKRVAQMMKARRERVKEFMPGANAAAKGKNFNIILRLLPGRSRLLASCLNRTPSVINSMRDHLLESF